MKKVLKFLIILLVIVAGYILIDSVFLSNKSGNQPNAFCIYKWRPVKVVNENATDGGIVVYSLSGKYIGSMGGGMPTIDESGKPVINPSDIKKSDLFCAGKYTY